MSVNLSTLAVLVVATVISTTTFAYSIVSCGTDRTSLFPCCNGDGGAYWAGPMSNADCGHNHGGHDNCTLSTPVLYYSILVSQTKNNEYPQFGNCLITN